MRLSPGGVLATLTGLSYRRFLAGRARHPAASLVCDALLKLVSGLLGLGAPLFSLRRRSHHRSARDLFMPSISALTPVSRVDQRSPLRWCALAVYPAEYGVLYP